MHHTILRFLTDNTGPSKNVNVVWLEAEAISPRINDSAVEQALRCY